MVLGTQRADVGAGVESWLEVRETQCATTEAKVFDGTGWKVYFKCNLYFSLLLLPCATSPIQRISTF